MKTLIFLLSIHISDSLVTKNCLVSHETRLVCGSNGKTYPNPSSAKCDGVFRFTFGGCQAETKSKLPTLRRIPVIKTLPMNPENFGCMESDLPVCGEDGVTYANGCEARNAKVSVASKGKCQDEK